MEKIKRVLAITAAVCMAVTSTSGCSSSTSDQSEETSAQITTEESSDPDALTVFLGNGTIFDKFVNAAAEKFPDTKFETEVYSGPDTSNYTKYLILSGETPDIVLSTQVWQDDMQKEYFLDLSGYDFVNNFSRHFLNKRDVDGAVYLLPTPYTINSLFYNKTLFEEMGWEAPTTSDEMVALIKQIREETDLIPVTITGKFSGTYFRLMTTFAQCGFLSTPDGVIWEDEFAAGTASSEVGFGRGLAQLQEWIDAGAFSEEDATNRDVDTYQKLVDRKAAFAFPISNQSYFADLMKDSADEFGALPFLGETESDSILTENNGVSIGLGKQLGEPENADKLAKALDILEFYSTYEGQSILSAGAADLYPLSDADTEVTFTPYEDIMDYVTAGRTSDVLYTGYEDVIVQAGDAIKAACFEGASLDTLFEDMDANRAASLAESGTSSSVTVAHDMTNAELCEYMAGVLLEEGGGDLAIVSTGSKQGKVRNYSGVSGRLLAGTLDSSRYIMITPGANVADVVNVSLTGSQIKEMLEKGRVLSAGEENETVFDYYSAGIAYEKSEDGSISEITLSDGTVMEDESVYRVSMAGNDFDSDDDTVVDDTGVTVLNAVTEYLDKHGVIE
jgi:raffinose/stachyose/melibiose transport system substrate-binding protein